MSRTALIGAIITTAIVVGTHGASAADDKAEIAREAGLEPLAEHHRADLKAACAKDLAIWPIYSVSYDPDHFDAQFNALLVRPATYPFAILQARRLVGQGQHGTRRGLYLRLADAGRQHQAGKNETVTHGILN